MKPSVIRIATYVSAAIVVVIIGAFAGWYVFLHKSISITKATDIARGFTSGGSFGSAIGSTYQNIVNGIGGNGGATSSAGTLAPRLWNVSKNPVAGFGFSSSSTLVYFAERATGNVLTAEPATSKITRKTNTLFAKIYDAAFASNGSVILRSVSDTGARTAFAGTLPTSTPSDTATSTPDILDGVYLPQHIVALSIRSPQSILYEVADPSGGAIGATSDWKGNGQKRVFTSALSGWQMYWLSDNRMIVAQNAADGVIGYAYEIQNGTLGTLLARGPGLVITPRASGGLLYSTSQGSQLSLYGQSSATSEPVLLPIHTSADKCAWLASQSLVAYCAVPRTTGANYLNNRYMGVSHSADSIWQVDIAAGTAVEIYTPDRSLDIERPTIDSTGNYIAFMNASDKSLWMFRIIDR